MNNNNNNKSFDFQAQVQGFPKAGQGDCYTAGHPWGNEGQCSLSSLPELHIQMGFKVMPEPPMFVQGAEINTKLAKHLTICAKYLVITKI